jgi:membrane protease YdiL (CAAX protease family)
LESATTESPAASGALVREWVALIFAMTFPTVFAMAYFIALARTGADAAEPGGSPAMQAIYGTGKVVQLLFPIAYLALTGSAVGPRRPSFAGLSWGLAFGLFTAFLILGIYHSPLRDVFVTDNTAAMVRDKVADMAGGVTPGRFLLLAVFLSVLHSLLEEYYWRWFVFGRLRLVTPVVVAAILSSLAFMAHHVVILHVFLPGRFWSATVPLSLAIAVGGGVWAWLFHRTGSIYSPWLSHMMVDMAIMAVGYQMLFG